MTKQDTISDAIFNIYWGQSDLTVWALQLAVDKLELTNPSTLPVVYSAIQKLTDSGSRNPMPAPSNDEQEEMLAAVEKALEVNRLETLITNCETLHLPLRADQFRMELKQLNG